jgi:thioesterase domain-containing protein
LTHQRYNYRQKKYYQYYADRVLPSGFTERSTWKGLKKAWCGYRIAKVKCEHNKMLQYASIIQKLQNELTLPISNFPDLDTPSMSNTRNPQ